MRHRNVLLCCLVLLSACAGVVRAQDGYFDPSFGTGGARPVAIEGYFDNLRAARVQADGRFVLAGTCNRRTVGGAKVPYFCFARLLRDGSFDTTFGPSGAGYLLSDQLVLPALASPYVTALALLPDGRIALAGGANLQSFVLVLAANGTSASLLYPVFNDAALESQTIRALAVRPDGKLIVAGSATHSASAFADFAVMRYNADLTPDATFGNGGVAFAGFALGATARHAVASAVALQRDGRIVLAGDVVASATDRDFALARLLADGAVDTSFNGSGRTTFSVADDDSTGDVAIDRRGSIVVAGSASPFAATGWGYDFIVNRVLGDGTQDPSFGGGAAVDVFVDFGGDRDDVLNDLALQGDGRILLAGRSSYSDTLKVFSLARLQADGSADPGFGIDGLSAGTFEPSNPDADWAEAVSLSLDGGIHVFGNGRRHLATESLQTFGVARLQLDAVFSDGYEP